MLRCQLSFQLVIFRTYVSCYYSSYVHAFNCLPRFQYPPPRRNCHTYLRPALNRRRFDQIDSNPGQPNTRRTAPQTRPANRTLLVNILRRTRVGHSFIQRSRVFLWHCMIESWWVEAAKQSRPQLCSVSACSCLRLFIYVLS